MKTVVHYTFCLAAALVAALPGVVAAMPSLDSAGKVAAPILAALMMALHYADPTDASVPAVKQ